MITPKRQIVRLTGAKLTKFYRRIDERDERRDQYTGMDLALSAEHHHRQFKSRGGQDVASNVVTLFGPGNTQGSHGWAHSSPEARKYGYAVPAFIENVEDVPIKILHPVGGRVWARFFNDFTVGFMTERDAREQMQRLGIWEEQEIA